MDNNLKQATTFQITSVLMMSSVEAAQPVNESAPIPLLNSWPEVKETKEAPPAAKPAVKKGSERTLAINSKKTKVVPSEPSEAEKPVDQIMENAPTQLASTEPQPSILEPETVVADGPEHELLPTDDSATDDSLLLEEDPEVLGQEGFEEDTPVIEEGAHHEEAHPEKKANRAGRKGFLVRAEGDDMVVYDQDGNEIFRKTREDRPALEVPQEPAPAVAEHELVEEPVTTDIKTPLSQVYDAANRMLDLIDSPVSAPRSEPSAEKIHVVKKGENPSIIASKYPGVTAKSLMELNSIKDPSGLQIGQKLMVPEGNGIVHIVKAGETLSDLEKYYDGVDIFAVCESLGISYTSNSVPEGTRISLKGVTLKAQAPPKKKAKPIVVDPSMFKGKNGWSWPVEFVEKIELSSPYGLRVDPFSIIKQRKSIAAGGGKTGLKRSFHHGIDISMPVNTPVRASRDGVVVKTSQSRYGHGKMVQIQHEDGWFTVYSHNSKILVNVGDRVKQGDIVCLSGNTGRSTGPHLHFEIRRPDQTSVDPRTFLIASK